MDETANILGILSADAAAQFETEGSRIYNEKRSNNNDFLMIYSKYGAISNDKQMLSEDSNVRRMW